MLRTPQHKVQHLEDNQHLEQAQGHSRLLGTMQGRHRHSENPRLDNHPLDSLLSANLHFIRFRQSLFLHSLRHRELKLHQPLDSPHSHPLLDPLWVLERLVLIVHLTRLLPLVVVPLLHLQAEGHQHSAPRNMGQRHQLGNRLSECPIMAQCRTLIRLPLQILNLLLVHQHLLSLYLPSVKRRRQSLHLAHLQVGAQVELSRFLGSLHSLPRLFRIHSRQQGMAWRVHHRPLLAHLGLSQVLTQTRRTLLKHPIFRKQYLRT